MAHTYLLFDFGTDEDKAQQARHKLESWRQAFRLDKKLQFKFDRAENLPSNPATNTAAPEKPDKPEKAAKSKSSPKSRVKNAPEPFESNGQVKLLVRLYFSGHEKLSEQRWITRIPNEEPFRGAAAKLIQEGEAGFDEALERFDHLD